MDCAQARPLIAQGRETEELLAHMASCAACRTRNEATEFVRAPDKNAKRPPPSRPAPSPAPAGASRGDETFVPPKRKATALLPFLVGAGALLVIIGASIALVVRQHAAVPGPAAGESAPPPPAPTVQEPGAAAAPSATHKLSVDSTPAGTVYIDGKRRGPTPYLADGVSGKLRVEVRAPGFATASRTVVVNDGDEELHLTLERGHGTKAGAPAPAADDVGIAPTGMGYLTIRATPYAHVLLDGKDLHRSTPIIKLSVPTGVHHVVLRTDRRDLEFDATVVKGKEVAISKTFD